MISDLFVIPPFDCTPDSFVPAVQHNPGANRFGSVQRRIIEYLNVAPGGFEGALVRTWEWQLMEHGQPLLVSLALVTRTVYTTAVPTAAQTRAVQRAVRQLADRGIVVTRICATGRANKVFRTHMGWRNSTPVTALYVARVGWTCDHTRTREACRAEAAAQRAADYAECEQRLLNDPVGALMAALGN